MASRTAEPKTKPTNYTILQREEATLRGEKADETVECWVPVGVADAHSPTDACKRYATKANEEQTDGALNLGTFRAVPTRSWPDEPHLTVEARMQPIFTYGSATGDSETVEEPELAGAAA